MVPIRIAPSLTERYSPAMPFCAASAMITRTRMSAMPTLPTRRRTTTRNTRNRNRYIAVPRTMSSSGEVLTPKIPLQSISNAALVAVDGAVAARALQLLRIELDHLVGDALAVPGPPAQHQDRLASEEIEVAGDHLRRQV